MLLGKGDVGPLEVPARAWRPTQRSGRASHVPKITPVTPNTATGSGRLLGFRAGRAEEMNLMGNFFLAELRALVQGE